MRTATLLIIIGSVTLTSVAQISLKFGMMDSRVQTAISQRDVTGILLGLVTSPWIVAGLFLFAISVVIWLGVLASVPLSIAYPFVALGIFLTTISGTLLFSETLSLLKIVGLALIIVGISFVSVSASLR